MINKYKYLALLLSIAVLVSSCASLGKGEPASKTDSSPPPGYQPVFIRDIKPYNPSTLEQPRLVVSTINASSLSKVNAKVHLVDNDIYFLSGAAQGNNKKIWCEIVDSINGKTTNVKNFRLNEIKETDGAKTAIAVIMDHSGSMGNYRANTVQDAVESLVNSKQNSDVIVLIKYDDKIKIESPASSDSKTLMKTFIKDSLARFGGMTAINDALLAGINELKNLTPDYAKTIIVFTDGWDNSSVAKKEDIIALAKSFNISINSVDFGDNINKNYMKQFSDSTSGIYHHIYSTNEFKLVFEDIYKRLKNYYSISYKTKEYGKHSVKIKLCLPKDTVASAFVFDNTPDIGEIGTVSINFDHNKSTINKDSEDELESIYALLSAYPAMIIELHGHTDASNSTGDKDYNLKLSQKRAESVKQALVKKGIDAGRILSKGFGDTMPIADNNTEEGRYLNRRTEFQILKK